MLMTTETRGSTRGSWDEAKIMVDGQDGSGRVRYTTYSHRSVYDPNDASACCEYESFSRGIRAEGRGGLHKVLISETHRTYQDSTGLERLGLARTLGDQGRSLTRERLASGEERSYHNYSRLEASEAEAFDRTWQEAATTNELDRVRFLKGPSRGRALHQRPRGAATEEERAIARRGRQMFDEHTAQLVRRARELGQPGVAHSPQNMGGRGPRHPAGSAIGSGGSRDEREAREWARREAERFWN